MVGLQFAVECTGARLAGGAPPAEFAGVSIDTRKLREGDMFVALAGRNVDGHDLLGRARESGASCAMVERPAEGGAQIPQLVVPDCVAALGSLAAAWRRRSGAALAAVTGSNGKTTVKEMLAAIMRRCRGDGAVLQTEGNLNNHLGVPLTLLRIGPLHECAVVEIGMSAKGEISRLSRIAAPGVALINNAMRSHLGPVGTLDDVARCKGEIIEGVPEDGTVVLNADDPRCPVWEELAGDRRVVRFSAKDAGAQARLGERAGGPVLHLDGAGAVPLELRLPGEHNRMNALAAAAAAAALGATGEQIRLGLSDAKGAPGRMQLRKGRNGMTLIDDTYNANPDSALEAVRALRARPEPRKVLVLGDMLELGDDAPALHGEVGEAARGLDGILTVGDLSCRAAQAAGGEHFPGKPELIARALEEAAAGTAILVKGSRGSAMQEVADALAAGEGEG